MSFREHVRGVTHNLIANIIIAAGATMISWYTAHQAIVAGTPRYVAILIGLSATALIAFIFAAVSFGVSHWRKHKTPVPSPHHPQPHEHCETQISNLQSEVSQLREQCSALTAQLAGKREQVKGLQREKDNVEAPRSKRADIQGEIREGSFVSDGGDMRARVKIRLIFFNRGELTTLRSFGLRVSHPYYKKTWESRSIRWQKIGEDMPNLAGLLSQKPPFELVPGIHHDGWLMFDMPNEAHADEMFDPAVIVTDGFGDEHVIESKLRLRRSR